MSSSHRLKPRNTHLSLRQRPVPFLKQRRGKAFVRTSIGLVLLFLFLFTLSRLSMISGLALKSVEIYGADSDITASLKAAAEGSIKGSYLGLFSKSNKVLYPEKSVIANVLAASPRIERADISRDNDTLVVSVSQRTPVAVVCASLPDFEGNDLALEKAEQCYFTDKNGLMFAESPSFSGTAHKRYYISDLATASSTAAVLGSYVPEVAQFSALQSFYDAVRGVDIDAQAILIKGEGEYEMYARNHTPDTGTVIIYFNNAADFSTELENLISFWTRMLEDGRTKGIYPVFASIDVRYGSNVFYRLTE